VLYVSTELDTWETSTPEPDQDEICERCGYRRLDPEYYAWLRHRMTVAQQFRRSGRLSADQYQLWRTRFNGVHAWALARFGEGMLVAAVEALDPKAYQPPRVQDWEPMPQSEQALARAHLFPADGDWPFTEPVSPEAVAMVDAIRERALSLGWSEAALYRNRGRYRFPVGGDYGLACFLHDGCEVGEVTSEHIEIIAPSGSRLRLYNLDAPQPGRAVGSANNAQVIPDTSRLAPVCNQ
jgi:hypothetical protein